MAVEPAKLTPLTLRNQWFGLGSPIGVIGSFAALVEVALIIAAIFVTDIPARWGLIVFAAVGFFYISSWFFWILHDRPWVLYPPKDFGGETHVDAYVRAMSVKEVSLESGQNLAELVDEAIRNAVTSPAIVESVIRDLATSTTLPDPASAEEAVRKSLGSAADQAIEEVTDTAFVTIDAILSPQEGGASVRLPYDPDLYTDFFITFVVDRLNQLGLPIEDETFGSTWILVDRKSEEEFTPATIYDSPTNLASNYRRLAQTGIRPGMELNVVPVSSAPRDEPQPPTRKSAARRARPRTSASR
jgi:hypothetical protein